MDRRNFLQGMVLTGAATAAQGAGARTDAGTSTPRAEGGIASIPLVKDPGQREGEMLYRTLGKTGERVSAIGLGGFHFGKKTLPEKDALRLLHSAIERGITFMDNSWDYNEGQSELRMGKGLAQNGSRKKVFLMSKIDGRTREAAQKQIDESLKRLKTDHVDLMMHHEIIRFDDPDRIFERDGAMAALLDAQKAGKVRFTGFTGHKDPQIHLYMLDAAKKHNIRFDAVLMPINVMDAHYRSFAQLVLPRLVEEQIGVLSMKPFCGGGGIVLKSQTVKPLECLHYPLSLPTNVVVTGIDSQQVLDQAFEAVKTFKPLARAELDELLARTRQVAMSGEYEMFKTSAHFDSTAAHPEWLGKESERVKSLTGGQPG